jgi:hypothetical protein
MEHFVKLYESFCKIWAYREGDPVGFRRIKKALRNEQKIPRTGQSGTGDRGAGSLCLQPCRGAVAEQKRNTPDGRKCHQNVDQSAENGRCAAEHPCDQIQLKNADKTPVDTADNQQYQSKLIPHDPFPHFAENCSAGGKAFLLRCGCRTEVFLPRLRFYYVCSACGYAAENAENN